MVAFILGRPIPRLLIFSFCLQVKVDLLASQPLAGPLDSRKPYQIGRRFKRK
jgi:hypothetical protein